MHSVRQVRIERRARDPGHRHREQRVDAAALHARTFQCQVDRLLTQLLCFFQPHAVRVAPSRQAVIALQRQHEVPRIHANPLMKPRKQRRIIEMVLPVPRECLEYFLLGEPVRGQGTGNTGNLHSPLSR
jgi:hypothetical protein